MISALPERKDDRINGVQSRTRDSDEVSFLVKGGVVQGYRGSGPRALHPHHDKAEDHNPELQVEGHMALEEAYAVESRRTDPIREAALKVD